jgi:hypothetical protein
MILDMLFNQEWIYFAIDLIDMNEVDLEIVKLLLKVLQNIYLLDLLFFKLRLKVNALVILL